MSDWIQYVNLLPVLAVVWWFYCAMRKGIVTDHSDRYFQENKRSRGRKYHNLFGVPRLDF
ncbi:MAG: hypothetical protein H7831_17685 [Magnetococcus sp. WYHC-3]